MIKVQIEKTNVFKREDEKEYKALITFVDTSDDEENEEEMISNGEGYE